MPTGIRSEDLESSILWMEQNRTMKKNDILMALCHTHRLMPCPVIIREASLSCRKEQIPTHKARHQVEFKLESRTSELLETCVRREEKLLGVRGNGEHQKNMAH